MSENLKLALEYLFQNEGDQYVDNPSDSGGPTKFGVTEKMYSRYLGRLVTVNEMQFLTKEDVGPFYEKVYWNPIWGDRILSCPMAIAIFDTAVLYGVQKAVKFAQFSIDECGLHVSMDGIMGEQTIELLNKVEKQNFILELYNQIRNRINEVVDLNPKNEVFRRGWSDRANRLLTLSDDPKFNLNP